MASGGGRRGDEGGEEPGRLFVSCCIVTIKGLQFWVRVLSSSFKFRNLIGLRFWKEKKGLLVQYIFFKKIKEPCKGSCGVLVLGLYFSSRIGIWEAFSTTD